LADYIKQVIGRIIDFRDSITENEKYVKELNEIKTLGKGSFGQVFEVSLKNNQFSNNFNTRKNSALKKLKFSADKEELLFKK
jgi:hypothetical protein